MASGVKLAEGCMEAYNDIQKAKKHLYAIFVIKVNRLHDLWLMMTKVHRL
jgi:hypothetical protein